MKKSLFILAAFVMVLTVSIAQADEIYYVQSMKAKVMSEPSFKSKVIAEIGKGFKLSASVKTGTWIKVTYGGMQGYVAGLLVSSQPPLQKTSMIKASDSEINQGVRRRASTYTSAAAARGLTHEDRKRLSTEEEVNYAAVEKMETVTFTSDEVTRFIEGGR